MTENTLAVCLSIAQGISILALIQYVILALVCAKLFEAFFGSSISNGYEYSPSFRYNSF